MTANEIAERKALADQHMNQALELVLAAAKEQVEAAALVADAEPQPVDPEPPVNVDPPVVVPSVPAPSGVERIADDQLRFQQVIVDGFACTGYEIQIAATGEAVGWDVSGPDADGVIIAHSITTNAYGHALRVRAQGFLHTSGQIYPEGAWATE